MMCCTAALLTFLTSHRSEYRGPGPGAQSCADSSSSPTPCMFSLPPPAWAYLAPLAHTSLPRKGTGKPHPVHIPSGGGRLKEAAHGLNDVGWTSRAEGDDTSPHGHRQASLPCDGKCRPCSGQALVGSHSRQRQGNTPPLPTDSLRHRVPVVILVDHVTMAGCKLRAQNHAPATEMYARRPSTDGSDDCAGSARPSFHTAPRRSGTP